MEKQYEIELSNDYDGDRDTDVISEEGLLKFYSSEYNISKNDLSSLEIGDKIKYSYKEEIIGGSYIFEIEILRIQ